MNIVVGTPTRTDRIPAKVRIKTRKYEKLLTKIENLKPGQCLPINPHEAFPDNEQGKRDHSALRCRISAMVRRHIEDKGIGVYMTTAGVAVARKGDMGPIKNSVDMPTLKGGRVAQAKKAAKKKAAKKRALRKL
ncbi:MAG: hypothetical protein JKY94_17460 [Rhodobacteraceae bacterium]|nr:hypothetical protein [Paracoccaceae bacterium]